MDCNFTIDVRKAVLWAFFFFLGFSSNAQQHQWITGGGSHFPPKLGYTGEDMTHAMTTDEHGNLYVLAEFMAVGSITFDTLTLPIKSGLVSA